MGWLEKLTFGAFGSRPQNSGAITTSADLAKELLRGTSTLAGVRVTPATACEIIAVSCAVSLIAETMAMLPLPVYKRDKDGGKTRNPAHWAYDLLNTAPNNYQNAFEFREMMQSHLMLWGNCYAAKTTLANGEISELLPMHPDRVTVGFDARAQRRVYRVNLPDGTQAIMRQVDVFHIMDRSFDGLTGTSRVGWAREGLAGAKAAENFGGSFFGNSGQPSGILSTDQKLTAPQIDQLRDSWKASHGSGNAFAVAVLDAGMKFSPITALLKDAQFIEYRKFAIAEVSRIWRIPPHLLGDLEKSTFSNIEEQGREFVMYSLLPWLRRWEMAINTQVIAPQRMSPHFAEYLVDGLLRGAWAQRVAGYSAGLRDGWLNVNEVREMENRNKIDGGDEYKKAESIHGSNAQQTGVQPNEQAQSQQPGQEDGGNPGDVAQ